MPLYTVPIQGPNGSGAGTITVNASDPTAAAENAKQGGNIPTGPAMLAVGASGNLGGPTQTLGAQTPGGINPGDASSIAAAFAASSGLSIKQLEEQKRQFDLQLAWAREQMERLGLPQLEIQKRLADAQMAMQRFQMVQATQNQRMQEGQLTGYYRPYNIDYPQLMRLLLQPSAPLTPQNVPAAAAPAAAAAAATPAAAPVPAQPFEEGTWIGLRKDLYKNDWYGTWGQWINGRIVPRTEAEYYRAGTPHTVDVTRERFNQYQDPQAWIDERNGLLAAAGTPAAPAAGTAPAAPAPLSPLTEMAPAGTGLGPGAIKPANVDYANGQFLQQQDPQAWIDAHNAALAAAGATPVAPGAAAGAGPTLDDFFKTITQGEPVQTEQGREFDQQLALQYLTQAAQFANADPFQLSDFMRGAATSNSNLPLFLKNLQNNVAGSAAGNVGPNPTAATTLPQLSAAMQGTGTVNPQTASALEAIQGIYGRGAQSLGTGTLESLSQNELNTLAAGIKRLYGDAAVPAFLEQYRATRPQQTAARTSYY